jgi:DNA-binding response OmpR family regulator
MAGDPIPRLLVVDDEPTVREILVAILDLNGFDVTSVSMGSAAIRLLGERSFDLVLLDVNMPGTSGWQVLDQMRAIAPVPHVLMISDERYEEEAHLRGVGFLAKPYRRSAVEAVVRRMLESASALHPDRDSSARQDGKAA